MLPLQGRKRRFGDRKDGFRVRNIEPMNRIEPFVMPEKSDAWVLFEDTMDITHVQEFVREHRRSDMPDLTLYHVLFASFVRAISQVPQINRFSIGHNIYARNELKFAMVVKKGLGFDADRTIIMPRFHLDATLPEVKEAIEKEVNAVDMEAKSVKEGKKSGFDSYTHPPLCLFPSAQTGLLWPASESTDRFESLPFQRLYHQYGQLRHGLRLSSRI